MSCNSIRATPTLALVIAGATALACSGSTTFTGRDTTASGGDSGAAGLTGAGAAVSGGSASDGGRAPSGGASQGAGAGGRGSGGAPGGAAGQRQTGGRAGASGSSGMGSGGTLDDGGAKAPVHCSGTLPPSFPSFSQECARDEDCVLVHRQVNCCGSVSTIAINKGDATAFATAAATCASQFPLCDCLARTPPDATARCLSSLCQVVPTAGATFMCGTTACSAGQYCVTKTPGAGGVTTSSCATDPKNPACAADCIYCSPAAGCMCSDAGGHVAVTCNGI